MLLNAFKREVLFLCVILGIGGISALARVDNNWSHRRPNITVAQNHGGQAGYRPAVVGYQQPLVRNQNHSQSYNNQQHNQQQQWQQNNNRPQYNQANQSYVNAYKPQHQPAYGQRAFNQTRPLWQQPSAPNTYKPQQPAYGQAAFNQSRPSWQQPSASKQPSYGQAAFNQSRPAWQQPAQPNQPQYPSYGSGPLNQTRPSWQQPNAPQHPQYPQAPNYPQYPQAAFNQTRPQAPNYPQYPSYGAQNTLNQTRPAWPQPSAPQAPAVPSNSWAPPANQTLLYPQLPNTNLPQPPPAVGNNGIPLAPLQPAPQSPQGPHNWHSGGQAVLSYGPGYNPSPAGNPNKNPPTHQGSSNPYASMFN